jgi:hypothetical protein
MPPPPAPRFLITVGATGDSRAEARKAKNPPWFQVRAIRKRQESLLVHSVPPPSSATGPAQEIIEGPDGTFVIVGSGTGPCRSRLHRFRLTADGHATKIQAVPGGTVAGLAGGVAISRDGRRLAFARAPCAPGTPPSAPRPETLAKATLTTLDTTTGRRRTWTTPNNAIIGEIRWARDGRTLGYALGNVVQRTSASDLALRGAAVHALDTEAPGARLRDGRVLFRHPDNADTLLSATMRPDGTTGFGSMRKAQPPSTLMFTFSAGRPIRVTRTVPSHIGIGTSTGGEPRYACSGGLDAFGRVSAGTLTTNNTQRCGSAYAY